MERKRLSEKTTDNNFLQQEDMDNRHLTGQINKTIGENLVHTRQKSYFKLFGRDFIL